MRIFILSLSLVLALVQCQDYSCPKGKSKLKKIMLSPGDSYSFNTNYDDEAEYLPKTKCPVQYKASKKCKDGIRFSCSSFDLINRDAKKCRKGDRLMIGKKAYCKENGPDPIILKGKAAKKGLKIQFLSDKKLQASGAQCTAECLDGAAATTEAPTTTSGSGTTTTASSGGTGGSSKGYTQAWLRGEGPMAHVHEGIRLADKSGWVGIGETLNEDVSRRSQVQVRRINNEAATQWTTNIGPSGGGKFSVGYSVVEGPSALYVGIGLWQNSKQMPAVAALNPSTGAVLWTKVLTSNNHGGVRSCIMDNTDIVCAGYKNYGQTGFVFVADEGRPVVWRLNSNGDLITEKTLNIEGMGQVAKIRKDATSGFVACSTAWGVLGGNDRFVMALVKLDSSLNVEWSQTHGDAGGETQVFDMLVDNDGNYLLGGHTTVGTGVVNWDYVALKVNSQTRAEMWRKTYGQPRGFDARYIHDEMYGVALDKEGNYLLLGGSGDEYTYSANGSGEWQGWKSDIWGAYLVVVTKDGETLYEDFYGDKGGNNAGEWLSVDTDSGDVMIYTDSDTAPGFGFLKLTPVQ